MRVSFDRVADVYDETRALPPVVMKRTIKTLVDELRDYRTILDVGIGTGRYAKPLQENGFNVVGIDLSQKMLKKAIEKGVGNLLMSDACNFPFKNSSFDVTISSYLLHLIEDWKIALREITRVTTNVLVSITHTRPSPLMETYKGLLAEHGYMIRKIGMSELELKDIVKPAKSIFVAAYYVSTNDLLTNLNQKAYSPQWEVPDNLHRQVMQELQTRFVGKMYNQNVHIFLWSANELRSLLSKERFRRG